MPINFSGILKLMGELFTAPRRLTSLIELDQQGPRILIAQSEPMDQRDGGFECRVMPLAA